MTQERSGGRAKGRRGSGIAVLVVSAVVHTVIAGQGHGKLRRRDAVEPQSISKGRGQDAGPKPHLKRRLSPHQLTNCRLIGRQSGRLQEAFGEFGFFASRA